MGVIAALPGENRGQEGPGAPVRRRCPLLDGDIRLSLILTATFPPHTKLRS
jgi:hypothetical protein